MKYENDIDAFNAIAALQPEYSYKYWNKRKWLHTFALSDSGYAIKTIIE